jgi:hypothetical protein
VVAGWGPRISLVGLTGNVFVTPSPPGKASGAGTWKVALWSREGAGQLQVDEAGGRGGLRGW